ncbi:hypothetical protein BCR44DRAFT_1433644 [Catenaria anguillulae PL171]|uniref:Uncharacterized protein n=1 Tax=Catenaria anguillulae PL171 TaxID=765915 RepID=A0A1Y2HMR4_9FUNG|nr:hypothetical protein BCR44DRAFT_1433644 [Catenaria anguillulae PL171]
MIADPGADSGPSFILAISDSSTGSQARQRCRNRRHLVPQTRRGPGHFVLRHFRHSRRHLPDPRLPAAHVCLQSLQRHQHPPEPQCSNRHSHWLHFVGHCRSRLRRLARHGRQAQSQDLPSCRQVWRRRVCGRDGFDWCIHVDWVKAGFGKL